MQLDYSLLLDNIKRRRYDEAIRDHVLSASFFDENIPKSVRYALESMGEVDSSYAYKVYANTRKINESIDKELISKGIKAVVRYQGALRTETHIRLYGEVDMLFVMDETATNKDVFLLGQIIRDSTSKLNLQSADYGDGVHIRLITQKPVCKINVIPCAWINNAKFAEKRNEIYRGIAVFNFKEKTRKKYLPFLNMARVNSKDAATNGNYKGLIRLMRSLCTDDSIALNVYELAGLFHSMDDENFSTGKDQVLQLLPNAVTHMENLLNDRDSFEMLLSPSEKELVFGKNPEKAESVKKLLDSFGDLVGNLKESIGENLDAPIDYSADPSIRTESE